MHLVYLKQQNLQKTLLLFLGGGGGWGWRGETCREGFGPRLKL